MNPLFHLLPFLLVPALAWDPQDLYLQPAEPIITRLGPIVSRLAPTSACHHSLASLFDQTDGWRRQMLDANAVIPSGRQSEKLTSVGEYEQCLQIYDHLSNVPIYGRFCWLQVKPKQPTQPFRHSLALGLCVPAVCDASQLDKLFLQYFAEQSNNTVWSRVDYCQDVGREKTFFEMVREKDLSICLPILLTAIVLVMLGTGCDLLCASSQPKTHEWSFLCTLKCFSLARNTRVVFHIRHSDLYRKSSHRIEHRFTYLHGVRTLFIVWIIIAHSCSLMPTSITMPFSFIARHPHDMIQMFERNQTFGNFLNSGTLAVEAFFLISGMLLTALMVAKDLHKRVHFVPFVLLRWIRFAIPLVGVIVFHKCASLAGSGPFFSSSILDTVMGGCADHQWWQGLLFVQNWFDLSDTCIPISWFVSVDLQIHLIAFVLILLLRRQLKQQAYWFCVAMIVVSLVIPVGLLLSGMPTFSNLALFANTNQPFPIDSYIYLYSGTHIHLSAYFFGALLGLSLVENRKWITNETNQTILWWISVLILATGPFLDTPFSTHIRKGLHIGVVHFLWTLALGYQFYQLSQVNHFSRLVNSVRAFLSADCFHPFSRLSFSMYLTHMLVLWFNIYCLREPFEVNTTNITMFCFAIVTETVALAYLLFVLFECPLVNLMKMFYNLAQLEQSNKMDEKTRMEQLTLEHQFSCDPVKCPLACEEKPTSVSSEEWAKVG